MGSDERVNLGLGLKRLGLTCPEAAVVIQG